MDQGVLPTSPEPTVVDPTLPTTDEVIADTLTGNLDGTFADFTAEALGAATQASMLAFVRNNTMLNNNISLEQLFGKGTGAILSRQEEAHDPALLDTDSILLEVFGTEVNFVHDAFTMAQNAIYHQRQKAVQDAKLADCMSEFDEFFGPNAEWVKDEAGASLRPNVTMSAAIPTKTEPISAKLEGAAAKQASLLKSTVLLTLPTVYPNRQILHFDTAPFNPMTSRPKESTDRKTFTPQNIMMWTYEPKSKQFLSNTRVIQWSDGSTTLHVGSESYDIETYTDGALSFLGERRHMYRCEKAYTAIIETVPVDNHITVRSRSDKQNSIDVVTAVYTAKSKAENMALSIGLPTTGLPAFVGDAGGRKSVEEEYVDAERAALKKLIAQMEREGRPMSVAEQMRRDAQILSDVINVGKGIDALVAKQNEKRRQEEEEKEKNKAEREAANALKLGSKRVRIPGGVGVGGEKKKSRPERKTDREPTEYDNGMTAEEETEAVVASAEAEDIGGDRWRTAFLTQLEDIATNALDHEVKSAAGNTIEAIINLSKSGAVSEVRAFLQEVSDDMSIVEPVEALTVLVDRVEREE